MLKRIFVLGLLLIGSTTLAQDFINNDIDINKITGGDRFEYIQGIKETIIPKEMTPLDLDSTEFKTLVNNHKKDKNHPENYYAAQGGYTSYKGNKLSAMYYTNSDIMYMYATQEPSNQRISYYYTVLGHLKYIDMMYGAYPNYPYFARKYETNGKLYSTMYCPNKDTQIIFNNKANKATIWYKNEVIDKIKI